MDMAKIHLLQEKLKDERGKTVVFLSHCLLNENTRYLGGACRKACVDELIDDLQKQGIGIVQMKCPEQKTWGGVLKREMHGLRYQRNPSECFSQTLHVVVYMENQKVL